jgi:hypothetical protein
MLLPSPWNSRTVPKGAPPEASTPRRRGEMALIGAQMLPLRLASAKASTWYSPSRS